jgi:L-lactate utilization protein LutC
MAASTRPSSADPVRVSRFVPCFVDQLTQKVGLAAEGARHGKDMPSMLSYVTGSSRTGDTERILVLGAHRPKDLFLVLVG